MVTKLVALTAVLALVLAGCDGNEEQRRLDQLVDVTVGDELVLDNAPPGAAARRAGARCGLGISPRVVAEHVVRHRRRLYVCRTADGTQVVITP